MARGGAPRRGRGRGRRGRARLRLGPRALRGRAERGGTAAGFGRGSGSLEAACGQHRVAAAPRGAGRASPARSADLGAAPRPPDAHGALRRGSAADLVGAGARRRELVDLGEHVSERRGRIGRGAEEHAVPAAAASAGRQRGGRRRAQPRRPPPWQRAGGWQRLQREPLLADPRPAGRRRGRELSERRRRLQPAGESGRDAAQRPPSGRQRRDRVHGRSTGFAARAR
mmetsp:Transcript_53439/g.153326  ORF Transcript_53439/g.153326 Transcript_53439/m.153326 type:complete len:227 (+) Transcript_53439:185-865(+)